MITATSAAATTAPPSTSDERQARLDGYRDDALKLALRGGAAGMAGGGAVLGAMSLLETGVSRTGVLQAGGVFAKGALASSVLVAGAGIGAAAGLAGGTVATGVLPGSERLHASLEVGAGVAGSMLGGLVTVGIGLSALMPVEGQGAVRTVVDGVRAMGWPALGVAAGMGALTTALVYLDHDGA